MLLKINWGQVNHPLYRGGPLFGGSVIRGFTAQNTNSVSLSSYETNP